MSPMFLDFIKTFGVPGAMLFYALWSNKRGDWIWKSQCDEIVKRLTGEINKRDEEIKELRRQYRDDMRKERDLSNSLLGVGERVAAAAERATVK